MKPGEDKPLPYAPIVGSSASEQGLGSQDESSADYWRGEHVSSLEFASDQDDVRNATPAEVRKMYAAQAVRQRDHIAAGLLAIFLGVFGVHKFYLGYNKPAFIMLAVSVIGSIFTLGLAGAVVWLIAIIEGIMYLSKSQTDFDRTYVLNERDWF